MNEAPLELIAHGDGWCNVEYIRADALRAALGGYHDSDLLSLAESLRTFHDGAEATMERILEQLHAANARIAELEAAQRWISVDERLPEPPNDVLMTDGDGVTVGWLSQNGAWNAYAWSHADVTHWMPLPPPPIAGVEHEC